MRSMESSPQRVQQKRNVFPLSNKTSKTVSINLEPMPRRGIGSKGKRVSLITNHFQVDTSNLSGHFCSYSVFIVQEDGSPVHNKEIRRRIIMDGISRTYATELDEKIFAYDGNQTLYTFGSLPCNKIEFFMVLDNVLAKRSERNGHIGEEGQAESSNCKRAKHASKNRTFKIRISFSSQIPMKAIGKTKNWEDSGHCQEVLIVLNTIF